VSKGQQKEVAVAIQKLSKKSELDDGDYYH